MKINHDLMQSHFDQYLTHSQTAREHLRAGLDALNNHDYDTWQTHWDAYKAESKIANRHFGTYCMMDSKSIKYEGR